MHQEFINIAAGPCAPNADHAKLGYAELLEYEFDRTQKQKIMPT